LGAVGKACRVDGVVAAKSIRFSVQAVLTSDFRTLYTNATRSRLTPESRHSQHRERMSALDKIRTHAPQQIISLFDHLVSGGEQRRGQGESEHPSGF
jgi:hypothetical protein